MNTASLWLRTCSIFICISLIAACGGTRTATNGGGEEDEKIAGERKAQELVNLFRQANSLVFSARIVYQPPKREFISFSLTGWAPADGRLRIRMTKIGVDFLEGILEADGSFTGVLVRDEKIIKGNVDELMPKLEQKAGKALKDDNVAAAGEDNKQRKGAPLLALVDLIRNEIKHGPINIRQDGYRLGTLEDKPCLFFNLPHNFRAAAILGSRKKRPVEKKIIYDTEGKEVIHITYDRLKDKDFDGLKRLSQIIITFPDIEDKQNIFIREIDAVKNIGADRMALDIPKYPEISIEDFGKKVVE